MFVLKRSGKRHGLKVQFGCQYLTMIIILTLEHFPERPQTSRWEVGAPTLSNNIMEKDQVRMTYQRRNEDDCGNAPRRYTSCTKTYNIIGYENVFWVQGGLEAAEEEVTCKICPLRFGVDLNG